MARRVLATCVVVISISFPLMAQVVVTPTNAAGWSFTATAGVGVPPAAAYLAPGFETPPLGAGSVHLSPGSDGNAAAQARHGGYAGVLLSNLTALSYSTFTEVPGSGGQAPYLILNVDRTGDGVSDDLLFFEPAYQTGAYAGDPVPNQGALANDTWQTWDALAGGWWVGTGGPPLVTLANYIAANPTATIAISASGAVRIVTGFGAGAWNNYRGAADNFTIGVSGVSTTYDFESAAATVVTVTPSALDGWTLQVVDDDTDTITTGSTSFVAGPATPPMGDGSLQFSLGAEGEDGVQARNAMSDGQFLRDLTQLSYSTYVQTPGSGGQTPYIILDVDLNNDGVRDDLWFFEPVYQSAVFCPSNPQPAVAVGSWQTWEAANGCWYSLFGTAGSGPGVNVVPLATLLATEPDARLSTNIAGGSLRIVTGFGDLAWDNFVGNADAFNVAFTATPVTYDFEPVPAITIADVSQLEGTGGATNFTFTLTLSEAVSQTVTVDYTTTDGTATTVDLDYSSTSGTATFVAGTTTASVVVPVTPDNKFESDETFTVDLSAPQFATIADAQALGTILNDDAQPSIVIADVSANEGDAGTTTFGFLATLTNPSSQTVTVNFATAPGSATEGVDYAAAAGTLTFLPNTTTALANVDVVGDGSFEVNETFVVNLSGATNATIGDAQATGTILNDDAQPQISITDVSQLEGDAGSTNFAFTVTLSSPSSQTVTVDFATADGSATAGVDYTGTTGTLTFVPGDVSETIAVAVIGDLDFEAAETFFVNLTAPSNATVADTQGLGTIQNDDGQPSISITDVTLPEGNAGATNFVFTVTLSNPTADTVTVSYATAAGTATEGVDYTAGAGMVTFVPGDVSETITVVVSGDTDFEPNETFAVNLSGATNATIADSSGSGTIQNDDGPLADLSITKTGPAMVQRATNVTYTITVANAGPQTASAPVVTDVLPAGATFVSATPSQGSCSGTGTVTCNLGPLASGASATIQLVVTLSQSVTNTATVSNTPEVDATPANNSASTAVVAVDQIPTMSEWLLILMLMSLAIVAVIRLR